MNWWVILLTAIGLSMDAFAVAIASGASIREQRTKHALRIGGCFGLFQMMMPILGWLFGSRLKHVIMNFDHWVVFILLSAIGGKMIHEAVSNEGCTRPKEEMTARRLLVLSLATSLDAFAVGVSFAFLECPLLLSSLLIGVVTFIISSAGVMIGHFCCCAWGKRAEFAGGLTLILIGLKILLEHLWTKTC